MKNLDDFDLEQIDADVIDVLRTCYDPEIPVDIYELGLIYQIRITPEGAVTIRMTLTSPSCPVAESLLEEIQDKVEQVQNVTKVDIDVVWDPPWNPGMMSEAAKLEMGML